MSGGHLERGDPGYAVYLAVFYACMAMMGSIAIYGIAEMHGEWARTGHYVLRIPTPRGRGTSSLRQSPFSRLLSSRRMRCT